MEIKITQGDSLGETVKSLKNLLAEKNVPESEKIEIVLSDGEHKSLDRERIFYDLPNPLSIKSESMNPHKCALRGENCETFHKDTENRALITFGMSCTEVTLEGFTIENTHVKYLDNSMLGNQAETICWYNDTGFLYAENMRFLSRQDTIHARGFSHFKNCYVEGDVDYIWGYCDTSIFDNCHLHTIKDNRGDDRMAYVLQSRAYNARPGFIFINCDFTAEPRGKGGKIFVGRSQGTGSAKSVDRWDSIALINCTVSPEYDEALWTDENGTKKVWPEKGSALSGWREFNTRIKFADGREEKYDSSKQEKHGYTLTQGEVAILQEAVEKTSRK